MRFTSLTQQVPNHSHQVPGYTHGTVPSVFLRKMRALLLFTMLLSWMFGAGLSFSFPVRSATRLTVRPRSYNVERRAATPMKDPGPIRMTTDKTDAVISFSSVPKSKVWNAYLKTSDTLTNLFPLWTVLFASLALTKPQLFSWFTTNYFTAVLGLPQLTLY